MTLPGILEQILGPPAPKAQRDGTHRSVSPAETVARVQPLLARAGITRIADVTGLDFVGLPVIQVVRPNSRSLAVSQGKGLTRDAAIASGVMESLELHHAETIDRPLRLASVAELADRARIVDPWRLPLAAGGRLHDDVRLLWTPGVDLVSGDEVWVPYEVVDLDSRPGGAPATGAFAVSSNGLASGNTIAEAAAHALFELVERDATTLWHCQGPAAQAATRIDLSSVGDPSCRAVIDRCTGAGLAVVAWDQTQDVRVPTVQCLLAERGATDDRLMYTATGMGTHATPEVAFLRALTEAAQSRLTLIAGSRDDVFESDYEIEAAAVEHVRELIGEADATRGPVRFDALPSFNGATTHDDVAHVLAELAGAGMDEAILVDLTQPDFDLPVARVVVPGLEGCDKMPDHTPGERALRRQGVTA